MIRWKELVLVVILAGCGRGSEQVASFSDSGVNPDEFRERYQRYLEFSGQRDNILLRKEILNNMINEKLIIADLSAKGFPDWQQTREKREQIRLQAILDRYSRKISTDTLTLTEEEFRREFQAYNTRASVRYLYARSEQEAWVLKEKLEQGMTFQELAPDVFEDPGLATNGGHLGSFGWGEMEPALEEKAFFLPVGEVSDPFPMKIGYGIVKVESRAVQPLRSEYDYAKAKPALGKVILQRKTLQCLKQITEQLAREAQPVFSEHTVASVLDHWPSLMETGQPEGTVAADISQERLVKFVGGSWTVADFLKRLERTSEQQRKRVHSVLDVRDVVTGIIVREQMLRDAVEEGLADDPDVLAQINSVYHQYCLSSWRELVTDTIGASGWDEGVLRSEYAHKPELQRLPPEVNVSEILVRTREEAEEMARKARAGADFATLARKHSIRIWAGKRGGELGFGTRASFGTMGNKFFEANRGAIIGPDFVDPYHGVFKVLDYREGKVRTFEEAREEIIGTLVAAKEREVFAEAVRILRSEAVIEIDETVLANIAVENQQKGEAS